MHAPSARERMWNQLETTWDVVVVGGGSTGAAVLREAVRAGLRAVLVEMRDFAWGTSSRSTKLAQGGLRYLDTGDVKLVRESVRERERLIREGPGLARPLEFVGATKKADGRKGWKMRVGVIAYNLLAGRAPRLELSRRALTRRAPAIAQHEGLVGIRYAEAQIDDARLVLRLLQEAQAAGALALNYVRVEALLREEGAVRGVRVRDALSDRTAVIRAKAVVNATGVWADTLRSQLQAPARMRPLRGSHLVFSNERFPLPHAISFRHPRDGRFVCVVPWEDVTLVGTTDHDHTAPLDEEPAITPAEVDYLLEAAQHEFPALRLQRSDVVSTFSGIRPLLADEHSDPSAVSREHFVFEEEGLVTITGGKLTTCRAAARAALGRLHDRLPQLDALAADDLFLDPQQPLRDTALPPQVRERLVGRYGALARQLVQAAQEGELHPVPGTSTLWAEVRWAARREGVVHLDDLLLRRVRLGNLLPHGGAAHFERVRALCEQELGWDEARWSEEEAAYRALWTSRYGVPRQEAVESAA